MAKKETPAAGGNGERPAEQAQGPQLAVLTQYVKDFSFENPNSPNSLLPKEKQPEIQININVTPNKMSDTDFEVVLKLEAKAGQGKDMLFNAELEYAGIFRISGLPEEALQAAVLVECPRLLFPFARHILSDATRNGGFPPLMIDPVDFVRLYQQRMAQAQAASKQDAAKA